MDLMRAYYCGCHVYLTRLLVLQLPAKRRYSSSGTAASTALNLFTCALP